MARKTRSPSFRSSHSPSRDWFLAGVGAVSLGRKQALASWQQAAEGLCSLRGKAETASRAFAGGVRKLRRQLDARVVPVQKKAQALAAEARAQAGHRLVPVLARFGVRPAPAQPARRRGKASKRVRRAA